MSKKKKAPVATKGAFPGWSSAAVFRKAGGANGLAKLLRAHGLRVPSSVSLRLWLHRGLIPGFWMPSVCVALAKAGLCKNPLELIVHSNNARVNVPDIFR